MGGLTRRLFLVGGTAALGATAIPLANPKVATARLIPATFDYAGGSTFRPLPMPASINNAMRSIMADARVIYDGVITSEING